MTAFESYQLWGIAATGFEDMEAAAQIASFVTGSESLPKSVISRAQFVLGYSAAAGGRFRDQGDIWAKAGPDNHGNSILERSLAMALPVYPVSDDYIRALRAEVNEWDTLASPVRHASGRVHDGEYWAVKVYLDALLSMRLNDAERFEAGVEVLADRADSTSGKDLAFSLLRSLEAIEAWKAGQFEQALDVADEARLRILWRTAYRSVLYEQVVDRFVKAEVLLELGEFDTALELYRSLTANDQYRGLVFLGPSYVRQAEIHERLGEPTKAIEYYTRFLRLWRNCDPELIPMREEARRNLDRLFVESTREPAS
jgi:tetratricopeptide (TPR) repeat protein